MDEIERKLGVIGNEVARIEFWPTGSSLETFHFDVTPRSRSLLFVHNDIRVEVSGFKLIDPERWSEDPLHRMYPAVSRSGVGELWYMCDVSCQVGKLKGKADNVALGFPLDRSRALSGLIPGSSEWGVVEDLLIAVERVASALFENELLDKRPPGDERKYPDDRISIRERKF